MTRKYRQRGYQDDEAHESSRGPRAPKERVDGPRGRGLGKPTETVFRCARCGAKRLGEVVEVDAACGSCGSDLHTCTNCRYFDSAAANECRAEITERIARKSSRNDCSAFAPKATQESSADAPAPGDARAEFEALFDL